MDEQASVFVYINIGVEKVGFLPHITCHLVSIYWAVNAL